MNYDQMVGKVYEPPGDNYRVLIVKKKEGRAGIAVLAPHQFLPCGEGRWYWYSENPSPSDLEKIFLGGREISLKDLTASEAQDVALCDSLGVERVIERYLAGVIAERAKMFAKDDGGRTTARVRDIRRFGSVRSLDKTIPELSR